jgi:hypothetical protein
MQISYSLGRASEFHSPTEMSMQRLQMGEYVPQMWRHLEDFRCNNSFLMFMGNILSAKFVDGSIRRAFEPILANSKIR